MKRIRRTTMLVALVAALTLSLGGVALAAVFVGTNGSDELIGTHENDTLYGLNGSDEISGKPGEDSLYGGGGEDTLHGGKNADYVVGGSKLDTIFAGRGNDFVDSADGHVDDVFCGPGEGDRAAVDPEDLWFGCEIIVNGGESTQ